MFSTVGPGPRSHFILTELLPFRRERWFEDYPFLHYEVARRRSLSPLLYSQNTPEAISEGLNFNIFLGEHAPRPPYISSTKGGRPGYTLAHPIPKVVTRPCNPGISAMVAKLLLYMKIMHIRQEGPEITNFYARSGPVHFYPVN